MIEVLNPGPLTSIQDLGRYGARKFGVGQSGAMDDFAFQIANQLIGNPENTVGLELTLGNLTLLFHQDMTVSYTGADCFLTVDGVSIPSWYCFTVKAGQKLKTEFPKCGIRSYLAFQGGIKVPSLMESCSTDLKGCFGGGFGRALQKGDRFEVNSSKQPLQIKRWFGLSRRVIEDDMKARAGIVRFIPGSAWESLEQSEKSHFLKHHWVVSSQSNRLGYRLEGEPLKINVPELRSHGILPGCIQVPPSGEPIIQLNDANTCGGYPTIGTVITTDMHILAQARPRDELTFEVCSIEKAVSERLERAQQLALLSKQASYLHSFSI